VCQKLELRLAREAATKEEYADESTLVSRLAAIRGDMRSEIEDTKAHNRAVIVRSAFGRSAEAILKYVGIMSHALTCDVVGRCSVEDCAGMKIMLQHEKECSEGEECKKCHTLERIRLIASASFL
jgi:ERCC4-related helicase